MSRSRLTLIQSGLDAPEPPVALLDELCHGLLLDLIQRVVLHLELKDRLQNLIARREVIEFLRELDKQGVHVSQRRGITI
jgi:hypothetical protein